MKESFVIHSEYIEDLPEELKGQFLIYIYQYGIHGIEPQLAGLEKTVWVKIQRRIDCDQSQWLAEKTARSEAGKKSGISRRKTPPKECSTNVNTVEECSTNVNTVEECSTKRTVSVSVPVSVNDSVSVCVPVSAGEQAEPVGKSDTFIPPTLEELSEYCKEQNLNIDCRKMWLFYRSKGWRVGTSPMKDWKAAAQKWAETNQRSPPPRAIQSDLALIQNYTAEKTETDTDKNLREIREEMYDETGKPLIF